LSLEVSKQIKVQRVKNVSNNKQLTKISTFSNFRQLEN